jgi:hypothetical protein
VLICSAQNYPNDVLEDAQIHCKNESTKRGVLDQKMYDYLFKLELEGYDNLVIIEKKYKEYQWLFDLKKNIITKWTKAGITQWRMVYFNLNDEIDAYHDLDYGLKHSEFDKAKYDLIFKKYIITFPDSYWTMIRYQLKN